jgi:hypothetical protein
VKNFDAPAEPNYRLGYLQAIFLLVVSLIALAFALNALADLNDGVVDVQVGQRSAWWYLSLPIWAKAILLTGFAAFWGFGVFTSVKRLLRREG